MIKSILAKDTIMKTNTELRAGICFGQAHSLDLSMEDDLVGHSHTKKDDQENPLKRHDQVNHLKKDDQVNPLKKDDQMNPLKKDDQVNPLKKDVQVNPIKKDDQVEPLKMMTSSPFETYVLPDKFTQNLFNQPQIKIIFLATFTFGSKTVSPN